MSSSAPAAPFPRLYGGITLSICFATSLAIYGCTDQPERLTQPTSEPAALEGSVTGAAAAAIGADGRFDLAAPTAPAQVPIITAARAGELAKAMLRTYGQFLEPSWERQRGGEIDLNSLEMEPRIFFAETPYRVFPDGVHPTYKRTAGPSYLVRFASNGETVLVIAVSAYNTDIEIDSNGATVLPFYSGGDFFPIGVSPGPNVGWGYMPVTPEEAAAAAAARTRSRVAGVPRLVRRSFDYHPAESLWEIDMERPVNLRAKGGSARPTSKVYVGPGTKLMIAKPTQPNERHFPDAVVAGPAARAAGTEGTRGPAVLQVLPQAVTEFEEVDSTLGPS